MGPARVFFYSTQGWKMQHHCPFKKMERFLYLPGFINLNC